MTPFTEPIDSISLGPFGAAGNLSTEIFDPIPKIVDPITVEVAENVAIANEESSDFNEDSVEDEDDDEEIETEEPESPTLTAQEEEDQVNSAEASDAAALSLSVEGGRWDAELHSAMGPTCRTDLVTVPYKAKIRTGFVSYPRSGNSYIRNLLERATGFQTSSIYCDRGLQRTFHGECNKKLDFFVKVSGDGIGSQFLAGQADAVKP